MTTKLLESSVSMKVPARLMVPLQVCVISSWVLVERERDGNGGGGESQGVENGEGGKRLVKVWEKDEVRREGLR